MTAPVTWAYQIPCPTLVLYIAGGTLRHQPVGAGHMTVLQLHGLMGFSVLQWCHPILASTTRASCCTRVTILYGMRKWIQARAKWSPEMNMAVDILLLYKGDNVYCPTDVGTYISFKPLFSFVIGFVYLVRKL